MYINDFIYTEEDLKETVKGTVSSLFFYGLLVGAAGLGAALFTWKEGNLFLTGIMATAGGISLVTGLLIIPFTLREQKRQFLALYNTKTPHYTLTFLEDRILLAKGAEKGPGYNCFNRVKETPNFYLLLSKFSAIPVKKGAFTLGEEKEFLEFLKRVLPDTVKGKNKVLT